MGLRQLPFAAQEREQPATSPDQLWENTLPHGRLRVKPLPRPDELALPNQPGTVCLVTDDGGPTTAALVAGVAQRGWQVAVLSFPNTVVPTRAAIPEGVRRFELKGTGEEDLVEALAAVASQVGPVGAYIHLDPTLPSEPVEGRYFTEEKKTIVKLVFLTAKHLQQPLNQAAKTGRSAFLCALHLDGALGLGSGAGFDPVSSGLFGLVKTLNLEWDPVFCRSIDLDPTMDPQQAAGSILAELYDPNRLIAEVGYGPQGRCTVEVVTGMQEEENGNPA